MKSIWDKQRAFMLACDMKAPTIIDNTVDENTTLWIKLINEEFQELMEAIEDGKTLSFDGCFSDEDLEAISSEAIDLVYVVSGLLNSLGIDGGRVFDAIHDANMRKVGDDGKVHRRESDGKILKPRDWIPADIGYTLAKQPDRES